VVVWFGENGYEEYEKWRINRKSSRLPSSPESVTGMKIKARPSTCCLSASTEKCSRDQTIAFYLP